MKKDIHPKYIKSNVQCITCNNKFTIYSMTDDIKVDICENCHPFYTGKMSSGSKTGRIERFNKRFNNTK